MGHVQSSSVDVLGDIVGREAGRSRPYSIGQFEEDIFAALIGDFDPMHNDPRWRFDAGWTSTIVLGFHALSLLGRALWEVGIPPLVPQSLGRVRFVAPFPVGAEAKFVVRLDDVSRDDGGTMVRASIENRLRGTDTPTLMAEYAGVVDDGIGSPSPPDTGPAIQDIPTGQPIAPAAVHDDAFYRRVAARRGEWLGATPWTVVDSRSAHVFALLTSPPDLVPVTSPDRVHPFHVLSLRSWFLSHVGLPVLSDERMAAFNYGLDGARWYGPVPAGARIRDHVQLRDVREKAPGRHLVHTRHVVEAEGEEHAVMTADCLSLFAVRDGEPASSDQRGK